MTRRARGTGTIYQRADGRWTARVHDGAGKRVDLYGTSRKEVTTKLREAERSIEAGAPVRSDRLTLDAYLDQWLAAVAPSIRPRTLESYRDQLRLHVRPTLGHVSLARLSAAQVQGLVNDQLAAGCSARGVEYTHAVLRTALAKAERWGLVARNVARLVDAPKVRRPEIRPLTPTEAGRLLASVQGQDRTLYLLTLGLGLRQGEALGLRWQDVDLDAGSVAVAHTLQRSAGNVPILAEPKTAKSRRSLSLPAPVLAELREHRRRQIAERLLVGDAWQGPDLSDPAGAGYVFCSAIGIPLESHAVTHRLARQLAAAGLPRVTFHSLRHATASYLLAAGVPMRVVQEVLGHSQLSTTADIYSHVLPELQADAAARMGTLLDAIGGRPS
jgi:integrase